MLMVFADPADREQVTGLAEQLGGRVLEWYTSYALAEVPDDAARRRLEELFRVQDLTARYEVQAGGRRLDTSRPRIDREGTVHSHPDYADEAPLPPGPHHYLVQFIGPVKQEWLAGVNDAGGRPRARHGHFTYVVRAEEDAVNRIARLDYVRWLGHLPYSDRISRSARDAAAAPRGPSGRRSSNACTRSSSSTGTRSTPPGLRRSGSGSRSSPWSQGSAS